MSGQETVDSILARHGVTAEAVLELQSARRCDLESALSRIVQDDPAHTRAGFIVKSGLVCFVEQCNFQLPFWKWRKLERGEVEAYFPSEVSVSVVSVGKGFLGVVSV